MKVLIVKLSSMGDVIHTLPAITDAAKHHHDIEIHWLVDKDFSEIAAWNFAVKKVIPLELRKLKKKFSFKLLWSMIKQIRAEKYDLIIDCQGLIKSMVLSALSRGKVAGYSKHSAKEPIASLGYRYKYSIPKRQHAIAKNRELISRALNYELTNKMKNIDYGVTFPSQMSPDNKYVVFLHGTTWKSKGWSTIRWIELARIATQNGYNVEVTFATQRQKQVAQSIAQSVKGVTVKDHMSINKASKWLANAEAVVSVDTGFGHLAAALNKKVVGLYGPTDIKLTGILGNTNTVKVLNSARHCSPCMKKSCHMLTVNDGDINNLCLHDFDPNKIWKSLNLEENTSKIDTSLLA